MDNIINTNSVVLCEGGLDTTQNHLLLDNNYPGRATKLINYEVGLNGGYSRIMGYGPYSALYRYVDDTNAEGQILGVFIYKPFGTGSEDVYAARKQKSGNTYKIYRLVTGSGWTAVSPGFTLSSSGVSKVRYAVATFGNKTYIFFVDGVNFGYCFDGTTWYQLKSSNSGGSASAGGDQLVDKPSFVAVFKNHVFFSGDTLNAPAVVAHSAPNDPLTWTAAAGGGQLVMGFVTQNIKPFRDYLYVFGTTNISNITVESSTFVINSVTTSLGCLAPDSVIEIAGDILFLAPDGIRPISGTNKIGDVQMGILSKPIIDLINTTQDSYNLTQLNSVVLRKKSQFRYFMYSQGVLPQNAKGLIGGLRNSDTENGWEFGELQGIRVSSVTSGYINNREVIIHGDYDGAVYQQEFGNTFDDSYVYSAYSTPYLTFGLPEQRKRIREIQIFYNLKGDLQNSISMDFDWSDKNIIEPKPYDQDQINLLYRYDNGINYDSGATYSNTRLSPVLKTPIEGSCFSVKFTFASRDINPPHTIHGFIINYTPQGRR